ncbi:MAG: nucleotide exchange factor GrpE [Solirubrobacterales bacterium]|nr:nucleotide exchange factor GrpE [Solirubrobacterales bacterium]
MTIDDHTPEVDPQTGAHEAPVTESAPPPAEPADGAASGDCAGSPLVDPELVAEPLDDATTPEDGEDAAAIDDAEDQPEPAAPDYKDLYLRSAAEMDNLRKRARRDVGVAEARGIGRLAKELLPALDNLDRALAAAEALEGDDQHQITRGTRLVQAELAAALERVGIKVEIPLGSPFDPHRHEALTQQPRENVAPGLVVEVYQPGYVYEDTVLRAAKVIVSA